MKRLLATLILASLLASCSGNNAAPAGPESSQATKTTKAAASDYETATQALYVAYFGRPADPAGLANVEAALLVAKAPTDIVGLANAYASNAGVKALVDSFGTSKESQTLYAGSNTAAFVTAVFNHLLNRAPQTAGLNFWVGQIDGNTVTLGAAALEIAAGALGNNTAQGLSDAQLINNRLAVAADFSAQVTSQNAVNAYAGAAAAACARTELSGVTAGTASVDFMNIASTAVAGVTAGCNTSSGGSTGGTVIAKSAKRGIAYDLADAQDFAALAPGVSWWYNWSPQPNTQAPANYVAQYQMDFYPMLWNGNFNAAQVQAMLLANPQIKYLLVVNEPNLVDQANLTPQQAAALWPTFESIAANTGAKIVGPAITWGTMSGYGDPVVWLDAFYAAYQAANGGRSPQIDYLAFHWYDYGLDAQLDRLTKYGKPFWVTEFANWHSQNDGAQITTLAGQEAQMTDMVATCEARADVFRYAWFTGRMTNDVHFTSLLGASGQLTGLGQLYLSLPYQK
jgi:hypothetical protein